MSYFVAVHTGAGNCSEETNIKFKILCKNVCNQVVSILSQGKSASEGAILGTVMLENSPYTNAGLGSSISKDRQIRTEASLCSTYSGFHCAGDLKDIRHPIKLVEHMAQETLAADSIYIPPRIMVGEHAIERYSKIDNLVVQTNICTKNSIKCYHKASKYFNNSSPKRQKLDANSSAIAEDTQSTILSENTENRVSEEDFPTGVEDTVGVICVDTLGGISCAMSSGGSVYKYNGRLGQCCAHGAGCHVTANSGIVTTGNGEQIVNKLLAVSLSHKFQTAPDPTRVLDTCFVEGQTKMCGFLMVDECNRTSVSIHAQHTLTNMVFGFRSSAMDKPVSKVITSCSPVFLQTVKL